MAPTPQTPAPPTPAQAEQSITEGLALLAARAQTRFLAAHVAQRGIEITFDPAIPTAATDGRRIRVGPWLVALPPRQRAFVLAHEMLHCFGRHMQRAKIYARAGIGPDLKPFQRRRMNKAADYIINSTLIQEMGFARADMPRGGLLDAQFGPGLLADEVYCQLPPEVDDTGGGHGGFDDHLPPPDDEEGTPPPDVSDPTPDLAALDVAIRQDIQAASAIGQLPGSLQRRLDAWYAPQITWRDQLAAFLDTVSAKTETTWARPNRRRLVLPPYLYLPGRAGHALNHAVITVDVSGSITPRELEQFLSETRSIMEELRPRRLTLIAWDQAAEVIELEDPTDLETMTVTGGGGTDYNAAIRAIEQHDLDPDVIVCLTDGMVRWPRPEEVRWPHITACTSGATTPFGTTVRLNT